VIIRQGFFDGRIRPGMEEAFYDHVADRMVPVWRSFPGLLELRVSTANSPENDVTYPLHTTFVFPSDAALEAVLTSPERQESLARTKELMTMFDGRIYHVVTRPLVHRGKIVAAEPGA
jgi:antibiotic biosynthesis monooxygenase (ABM) superfamily enzyme